MFEVHLIIPTRNRPELLVELIRSLRLQTNLPKVVHIIDSSDDPLEINKISGIVEFQIDYTFTSIRSASIQRNIGIQRLSEPCDLVAFLDDDVRPQSNYLEGLIKTLTEHELIGVSGVAIDPVVSGSVNELSKLVKFFKFIFLLGSGTQGKLLISGVAIPITRRTQAIIYTDWLIGCSVWRYQDVKYLRFPANLHGQSLGEDVIYSANASKLGKLAVDSRIILEHRQSKINRPSSFEYWKMWSSNRKLLLKSMKWGIPAYIAYAWANLGQLCILIIQFLKGDRKSFFGFFGLILGIFEKVNIR